MASGRVGYASLLFFAIQFLVSVTSLMESHDAISREKELIRDLMENYKKFGKNGRPVSNTSDSILVEFGLTLIQIVNLDEKDQLLTTSVWYNFKWHDVLLRWDPQEYDNISEVRVPSDEIWRPDVVLYNFADTRLKEQREALVVLQSTGQTLWMPQAILKSTCAIDITYFPFDAQTCNLKFGSWSYNGYKLDIKFLGENRFEMGSYIPSNEWGIIENTAKKRIYKYDCCPEPYPDLYYTLKIKRRVAFYSSILILPCALLSLLTLIIFWVPPESPAKLQLGMNIFVAFFVLLLLLSDSTPRATSSIPLIGAYYCLNMLMITVSTFVSCIVANMFFRGVRKNRAPKWLRSLMIDGVATVLMLRADLLERDEDGNLRKWNGKITGEPKRKFPGTDIKYAKVRLLDTPNGREIGQKLSMAHEIIEYQHMRERDHLRHLEGDPLRAEMLDEIRSIREMVERVRDQKIRREDTEKFTREWRVIACITDRFFFVIYVIVNAVSLIVIFFTKNG